MTASEVVRETFKDGRVLLSTAECTFEFRRPRFAALLVIITGNDRGQFGTAALDEIRLEIMRYKPLELFVDARAATGASVSVSNEWTRFFSVNRENLKQVSVLGGSKVINLTMQIAQHLSRTGNLIHIHPDPESFEARVAAQ